MACFSDNGIFAPAGMASAFVSFNCGALLAAGTGVVASAEFPAAGVVLAVAGAESGR
jgi:hypothetical protein